MNARRIVLGCILAVNAGAVEAQPAQQEWALTNVHLVLPCENRSWGPASLRIHGPHIVALDSLHKLEIPAHVERHDMGGAYAIPGLVDSHFHIFQGDRSPAAVDRMRADLEYLLRQGVTSIRDMAGDARILRQFVDEEKAGAFLPRIFFAALFGGPQLFGADPRAAASSQGLRLGSAPWMRLVTDTSDAEVLIRDAKAAGASGIKLYSDISESTMSRLAEEAQRQGLLVWSHARVRPVPARRVVTTGVQTVSHAHHFLDELERHENDRLRRAAARGTRIQLASPQLRSVFDVMAARGVMFDPTLRLYEAEESGRLLAAGAVVTSARDAGVRILAGTDPVPATAANQDQTGGWPAVPLVHRELELLVEYGGLTPQEALRAATCDAPDALGMAELLGNLAAGRLADILVLNSDPLEQITNVRDVRLVVKNGAIIR